MPQRMGTGDWLPATDGNRPPFRSRMPPIVCPAPHFGPTTTTLPVPNYHFPAPANRYHYRRFARHLVARAWQPLPNGRGRVVNGVGPPARVVTFRDRSAVDPRAIGVDIDGWKAHVCVTVPSGIAPRGGRHVPNWTKTMQNVTFKFEYNGYEIDFSRVPDESAFALWAKGATHYLGNEQASKVTAWKQKAENANASDEAIEAKRNEFITSAIEAIYAGEIGAGRGPRLDPVEREFRSAVDAHIANTLAGNGIKFPKGRKLPTEDEVVQFANGATRTLEQMRENVGKTHGDKLRKDAEKRVADLARKAAQAKAQAEALAKQGPVSAEALGL